MLCRPQSIYCRGGNIDMFDEKMWDATSLDGRFLTGLHTSVNSNLWSARFIWTAELEMQWSRGIGFPRKPIQHIKAGTNWPLFVGKIKFFKCISSNENDCILIPNLQKFVFKGAFDNTSTLVEVMAWCLSSDKPLPEPVMNQFTDAYTRFPA